MPVLFESTRGRVVRLDDPSAVADVSFFGVDPDISFDSHASIVTRVGVNEQVNAQFLHTVGAHVYVYVFGDRVGDLMLSGLAFTGSCDSGDAPGIVLIRDWYLDNRLSKRKAPVLVTIGPSTVEGFLIRSNYEVVDPSIGLVQWNSFLVTLPED